MEMRDINTLYDSPLNTLTEITRDSEQDLLEQLKKGQHSTILIMDDGEIIGGKHRVRGMKTIGYEKVKCIILSAELAADKGYFALLDGVPVQEKQSDGSWAVSTYYQSEEDLKMDYIMSHNHNAVHYNAEGLARAVNVFNIDWDRFRLNIDQPIRVKESLKKFLIDIAQEDIEEDEAPAVDDQNPPVSELGNVYQLGKHRLMCGDATKIEDIEKLMDGNKADMVFTDPPYGVNYQSNGRTEKFDVLKNDDVMLTDWIAPALSYSDGWMLICTSWKVVKEWLTIGEQIGTLTNMIIWDKGGGGIGDLEGSLSTDYEIILAYNRGNKITGKRLGSVWSVGKDSSMSYTHPTQKPVALSAMAIQNLSDGSVLDLFGGSGSTLMACEQTGRTCHMLELDPKYCDVIRKRYAKLKGEEGNWIDATPSI